MPIGPVIRQMLGPFERPISELYRSIFVDLNALVHQIRQWTSASNILELGCGEGAIAERVVKEFPQAHFTGIDITPRVGRMFQGDFSRVTFKQQAIHDFAAENPSFFDLLLVCDILHHIPWELHKDILINAGKTLKPGGYLILKDWAQSATLIHFLCFFSDRYITGDHIRYKSTDELRKLIEEVFGTDCIKAETRIHPWNNNVAFLVQV